MSKKFYLQSTCSILIIALLLHVTPCIGADASTEPTNVISQELGKGTSNTSLSPDISLSLTKGTKLGVKTLGGQVSGQLGGNILGNVAGTAAAFGVQDLLAGQAPSTAQTAVTLQQGLVGTSAIVQEIPGISPLAPFVGQYIGNQYQTGGPTIKIIRNLQAPVVTPLGAAGQQALTELAPTIQSVGATAVEKLPTTVQGPATTLLGKLPGGVATAGETSGSTALIPAGQAAGTATGEATTINAAGEIGAQAGKATAEGITSAIKSGAGLVSSAAQGTTLGTSAGEFATQAGITGAKAATTAAEIGGTAARIGAAAVESVEPVTAGLAVSNTIGIVDLTTGGTLHQGISSATEGVTGSVNKAANAIGSSLGGQQGVGVNQISQGLTSLGANAVNIAENVGFGGSNTPTSVSSVLNTELGANANIVKGVANLIPGIGGPVGTAVDAAVKGINTAAQAVGQTAAKAINTATSSGVASGAMLGTAIMPGVGTAVGAALGAIPGVGSAFSSAAGTIAGGIESILGISQPPKPELKVQSVPVSPNTWGGTTVAGQNIPAGGGGVVVTFSPDLNTQAAVTEYLPANTGIHTFTTADGKTYSVDTTNKQAAQLASQVNTYVSAVQKQSGTLTTAENKLQQAQTTLANAPQPANTSLANTNPALAKALGLQTGPSAAQVAQQAKQQQAQAVGQILTANQQNAQIAAMAPTAPENVTLGPTVDVLKSAPSGGTVQTAALPQSSPTSDQQMAQGLYNLITTGSTKTPVATAPAAKPVLTQGKGGAPALLSYPAAQPSTTQPTATKPTAISALKAAPTSTLLAQETPTTALGKGPSTAALTLLAPATPAAPLTQAQAAGLLAAAQQTPVYQVPSGPAVNPASLIAPSYNSAQAIANSLNPVLYTTPSPSKLTTLAVPSVESFNAQNMADIIANTPGGAAAVMQLKGPTTLTQNQAAAILANPSIASPSAVSLAQSQFPTMTQQSAKTILNPPTPTLQPISQAQLTALSTPPAFPTSQYDLLKSQPAAPLPTTSVMPVITAPAPTPTYTAPITSTYTAPAPTYTPTPLQPIYTTSTGTPVYSNPAQSPTGNVTMGGGNYNPSVTSGATLTSSYTSGPMISAPVSTPWVPAANPEAGLQPASAISSGSQLAHTTAVAGPPTYSH